MDRDFLKLYFEFKKIKAQEWIPSRRNGPTGIGYTFEYLLNKKEDCMRKPDYLDIEIKTMRYFSKRKIHLFNLSPKCIDDSPTKRLVNLLGYPHKKYPNSRVFYASVNAQEYSKVGYKLLKLKLDYEHKKIWLLAKNIYGKTYKLDIFWDFSDIENALCEKMNKLAIVKALHKEINGKDHFYYTSINFYRLRFPLTFVQLIAKGIITINFKIDIYSYGNRLGKLHDKGTDFSMFEKDIELLYDKI